MNYHLTTINYTFHLQILLKYCSFSKKEMSIMWYDTPAHCDACPRKNSCNSYYGGCGCGFADEVKRKKESIWTKLFRKKKSKK